jgi:hypothetical protein
LDFKIYRSLFQPQMIDRLSKILYSKTWYTRENEQLFPVDIDRLEQDCAAPSEQVVNNIVTG